MYVYILLIYQKEIMFILFALDLQRITHVNAKYFRLEVQ